jgi:hypothetical protein
LRGNQTEAERIDALLIYAWSDESGATTGVGRRATSPGEGSIIGEGPHSVRNP